MTAKDDAAQAHAGFERLLKPASLAVIGGGGWARNVIEAARRFGFAGPIWAVHPTKDTVADVPAFASVAALPGAPDAAFVAVNRHASVEVVAALAARGAGGAVCFASGFAEAGQELPDGPALQADLVAAAGGMPILGPNCYGLINALDGAVLWPDVHGCARVDRGVAILTQSSNIALNLTMQTRGLPIAFVGTLGNQAQTDMATLGRAMLADPRVTALGLYIEGIADVAGVEALAAQAQASGKRIVAMKLGASEQAAAAAVSHTASLAGSDAGARALLRRLGVAQVSSLAAMLETLKILHGVGPLASHRLASMSCSGGEASLIADSALGLDLVFPPLDAGQSDALRAALGPKVALANPLDYHTYIWGDTAAMTACYGAMMQGDLGLGLVVLDYPRRDRCDASEWDRVLTAMAQVQCAAPLGVLASLPDTLPEEVATRCFELGLVPLSGVTEALEAIEAAAWLGQTTPGAPVWSVPAVSGDPVTYSEAAAKQMLAQAGVAVPLSQSAASAREAALQAVAIGFPVVLKGSGVAHKSEAGAVRLGLTSAAEVEAAAQDMVAQGFLVEQMVGGAVAELLIGVTRDPAHGFVLTLGAGGVLTEVLRDTVSLMLPVERHDVIDALQGLAIWPVLAGYRGQPAADLQAIWAACEAVQKLVRHRQADLLELEINPLICQPDGAVAVDALMRCQAPGNRQTGKGEDP